ncbi:MAG: hypothetical protein AAFX50_09710 [Acidobacteriota bacterium]
MAEISVRFRVVGIYFGAPKGTTGEITVKVEENPTVNDVMVAAAELAGQVGGINGVDSFSYSPFNPERGSGQILTEVSADFTEPPKGPGTDPGAGIYRLDQDLERNPQSVLQYYIFDSNFVQKNRENSFIPFSDDPPVPIEDGDLVLWRMVAITQAPNGSNLVRGRQRRFSTMMKSRVR